MKLSLLYSCYLREDDRMYVHMHTIHVHLPTSPSSSYLLCLFLCASCARRIRGEYHLLLLTLALFPLISTLRYV